MATETLLEAALKLGRPSRLTTPSEEQIDVVIAYLDGRISRSQLGAVLGNKNTEGVCLRTILSACAAKKIVIQRL